MIYFYKIHLLFNIFREQIFKDKNNKKIPLMGFEPIPNDS